MRKSHRLSLIALSIFLMIAISACGKKEDDLVLVTTEATATETTQSTTEATTAEAATEELSEKEKGITYQDMLEANKGDVLLAGGVSYSMNTIFYANGEETFSEYQFLGFDNHGMYSQVYEDSDGYVELLDAANNYWYVVKDNKLSILIYPEPLVAAAIIDSNHNSMIFGLSGNEDSTEIVQEVYKTEGMLKVETVYGSSSGTNYLMEYTLDDSWKVQEFNCYSMDGELLSYSFVTAGDSYEVPAVISEAMAMEQGYRTVTITYVDSDEMDMIYYTPLNIGIQLDMVEYEAYSDQGCTTVWTESEPDENGVYKDVTIYMKKNTKEGE